MNSKTEEKSTKRRIRHRDDRIFTRRARLIRNMYVLSTKKIREDAINRLQELAEEAQKRATSKHLATEARQKWAKIAAYLYQTLNSILNSYDEAYILEKLEEIEEYVKEHEEKGSGDREEN
jgi:hypothetical protein